ncbi:MAG TPA: hypothetical protein VIV63_16310 [Steroidobacteraceae bacterium]
MNSADVFSLEFDMLTRTSQLGKILERFRATEIGAGTHRQLLLELNHVINVHSRLREVAADVVPPDDWTSWQDLLAVPALAFEQGRSFLDDLRALGLNSMDSVSLTPLPQTIALAAYAHYQLVERATVGLVGYLWFFERMPRLLYPLWGESCRRGGVPEKALRALAEGAVVQSARDQVVANCCRQIVRRPRDLGLATQSLHDTAELFATMLDAALLRAERRIPMVESVVTVGTGIGQVA